MKVASFNVNGLRSRLHQLAQLIDSHSPDIIGLQETKVSDEDFPVRAVTDMGYKVAFHGQKTHYGVALLSKASPLNIQKGFPTESQRRVIIGDYDIYPSPFKMLRCCQRSLTPITYYS